MSAKSPKDQHYVGVELCAGSARAALVSEGGEVIARRETASGGEDPAGQVARLVSELRDSAHARVAAVGVGLPDSSTRRPVASSSLQTSPWSFAETCAQS